MKRPCDVSLTSHCWITSPRVSVSPAVSMPFKLEVLISVIESVFTLSQRSLLLSY